MVSGEATGLRTGADKPAHFVVFKTCGASAVLDSKNAI
jgi:hypothetical protein